MELEKLSAVEIGREVNKGNITPSEVIRYFADRIEKCDTEINAFTYTMVEDALAEAEKLERRLAAGEDAGPLAGVPVALKDFLPSKKGWTHSHGGVKSLIKEDEADSAFYTAARAAGAIAIGKTNAPAFGFRGTCDNKLYGPTRNPYNTDYNSGGSSGGSAAAVAARMVPAAQGTDAGGSIRIPSAWCNCFGYKASVGTVPAMNRPDGWAATHPYCFDGPITRTVTDGAVIMNYMAKHDPRDPLSLDHGDRDFTVLMKRPIKGWKIGLTMDFDLFPVDEEVASIVEKAAHKLEDAGAAVEPVHFTFRHSLNDFAELWCRSISIDTAIEMELWKQNGLDLVRDHADELPEEFIYWNKKALESTVMDYRYFNELRTEIYDCEQDAFEKYDLIISPVTVCKPVRNAEDRNTKGPDVFKDKKMEPLIGFCETFLQNFTGSPAASVPAGFTSEGLPTGMQIIGKKFRDEDVFAAAYTMEQIAPWDR